MNRRNFISTALGSSALAMAPFGLSANIFFQSPIKIGIIGLDTSHSPAFAKYFNQTDTSGNFGLLQPIRMVARHREQRVAYSKIYREVKKHDVLIVDSVKKLLDSVDVVLLETNDGRVHKEQAFQVIKARKPLFVDKPVAASMADVIAIYGEAKKMNVPIFSSSSLRYMKTAQSVRYEDAIGKVIGADTFSPATIEPTHPDLFWYGIHGVEILFTVMGAGCESVTRFNKDNMDVVVGLWKDGRIGTFRGTREGKHDYGGTAYGLKGNLVLGPFDGYDALSIKIAEFFTTKKSPVEDAETIEIYAFMEAAHQSTKRGGASVRIADVMKY